MDIEKLHSLTTIDFAGFIQSENNVKYKIVIPFLQAFNHSHLDLEHAAQGSRIDINIGNRIIVETKALGVNLNNHIQQLSDYNGRELPVLAILTNGKNFRIYSPLWKHQRAFAEKLIYEFELTDLDDIELLNRLETILGFSNYESEEFLEHIDQREKELLGVKKEIDEIKKQKSYQVIELDNEISELKEQVQELSEQIKAKEQIVVDIKAERIPEIENKSREHLLPVKTKVVSISFPNIQHTSEVIRTDIVGDKFIIESRSKEVLAHGRILPNGNFLVLKGSTISSNTAPKFEKNAPAAFRKRNQYIQDGMIVDRRFRTDVEFNSRSGAASLILGGSADGNKEWRREN